MHCLKKRKMPGFTLIEMIITIGIASLLFMTLASLSGTLTHMEHRAFRRDIIERQVILINKQMDNDFFNATSLISPLSGASGTTVSGCRGGGSTINNGGYFYYCLNGQELRYYSSPSDCSIGINCTTSSGYRLLASGAFSVSFSRPAAPTGSVMSLNNTIQAQYTLKTTIINGVQDTIVVNRQFVLGAGSPGP